MLHAQTKTKRIIIVALILMFLSILFTLRSGLLKVPHGNRYSYCSNNIQKLGIAIYLYKEDYGCFPPSFTTDENGQPMHSWRALILPYLKSELHKQIPYNFNEPWDSSYNKQFHDKMPNLFCCPFVTKTSRNSTPSYAMITGKNTISDCQSSDSLKDTSFITTIMLIEIKNANFNWLEPVDIQLDQLQYAYKKNKNMPNLIGSYHDSLTRNFNICTCDGSIHALSYKTTSIEVIKAMSTINGAKTVIEKENAKIQMKYFEFQDDKSEKK
jgi:hypothetical protein